MESEEPQNRPRKSNRSSFQKKLLARKFITPTMLSIYIIDTKDFSNNTDQIISLRE